MRFPGPSLAWSLLPVLLAGLGAACDGGCTKNRATSDAGAAAHDVSSQPSAAASTPSRPQARFCWPDGEVTSLAVDGKTLYMAGAFAHIRCRSGSGAILDRATGAKPSAVAWPDVVGKVSVAVADPARPGGYYIGGTFTKVGDVDAQRLARILPDGNADATFNPKVDGDVRAIAVAGDVVYAGGEFTKVGDAARTHLAGISATTGNAAPFVANADGAVSAIAVSGNVVYVGGDFEHIGGQKRSALTALDVTGKLTAFDGGLRITNALLNREWNGSVHALAIVGDTVFVGGRFSSAGGEPRKHLAAFDLSGKLRPWNPGADEEVDALVASKDIVHVGGSFKEIGGSFRRGLAAIDLQGRVTPWVASPPSDGAASQVGASKILGPKALAAADGVLYVGGLTGGSFTNALVAFDAEGRATSFNPNPDAVVSALAISGDTLYAGGEFNAMGGVERKSLAAIDTATGRPLSWNPEPDNRVETVTAAGGILYVTGWFTHVGGKARTHVAALTSAGLATAWDPNVELVGQPPQFSQETSLSVTGDTVYVGGRFDRIGGATRTNIAALDKTKGLATRWQADVTGADRDPWGPAFVNAIAVAGSSIYVGGLFSRVADEPRKNLAAIDAATGKPTSFSPGTDARVTHLAASTSMVFAGGFFRAVGGKPRVRVAAMDPSGNVAAWEPPIDDGLVHFLTLSDNTLYIGASFATEVLKAFDASSGSEKPFRVKYDHPNVGGITAIAVSGGTAYAAGAFGGRAFVNPRTIGSIDLATGSVD